jgi:hypothetical protein
VCTMTVVPTPGGHRLVCNRDEQTSRPSSTELVHRRTGGHASIMPLDPPSGGTWIGAADTGVVACLLNANPGDPGTRSHVWAGRRSRGVIVPHLLSSDGLHDAVKALSGTDPSEFPPFRVFLMCGRDCSIASSDGHTLHVGAVVRVAGPIILTSSGLGDDLVVPPRTALFHRLLKEIEDPAAAQDAFHAHAWPDRPHLSVNMSRADARTVSRSTVLVEREAVLMQHERIPEGRGMTERLTLKAPSPSSGVAA